MQYLQLIMKFYLFILFYFSLTFQFVYGQANLTGTLISKNDCISNALVGIKELNVSARTDENGKFEFKQLPFGEYHLVISAFDFQKIDTLITLNLPTQSIEIELIPIPQLISEMVVSGNLKEVSKLESIVPVELYTPKFFAKNPSSNLMECMSNINGVRPQMNCNICNTGDIHINGLEGPYTMILIDGMPIVSSLSTVYGLSGIPNSLIDRLEIIRGPASTLYGSEAIGGVLNVITKNVTSAPKLSVDVMSNTWLESNVDLGTKFKLGKKVSVLTGINYFNYSNPIDNNKDGFTDLTLQERISIFQKWQIHRKNYKQFSIAGRYFYEDRWGGQTNWNKTLRGSDSIYGETIYTKRWELMGTYELPIKEKVLLSFSANNHNQNSYYGTTSFMADQRILFGQAVYYKTLKRHELLLGTSVRDILYDDNTIATLHPDSTNAIFRSTIPGVFIQDEWNLSERHKLLLGMRYDYNSFHGSILTPRLGYKWNLKSNQFFRLNTGTGYRVVNVFTEDHAALTGARKVEIADDLAPETSYNVNLNYFHTFKTKKQHSYTIDLTGFYTYFTNKIVPDYLTDVTKISYDNLNGFAESKGVSLNLEGRFSNGWSILIGGTLMDVSLTENGIKQRQLLSENFTGTWTISYIFKKLNVEIDYTGNVYSPMLLPVLGELDPRPSESPWWSIQNIKFSYKGFEKVELYAGVKNLLNWTPSKNEPNLIARAHDPFDQQVQFSPSGEVIATPENPYAMTFDPSYVYAPNQGVRVLFGVSFKL